MLIDSAELDNDETLKADICIIGGGVAGIVLALELEDKFDNIILLESGGENYEQAQQKLYEVDNYPRFFPNPIHSRLRFLGGSSNHWENNTSEFDALDFKKRAWMENSEWPISLTDLRPFYQPAAEYCGTETDSYQLDYWQKKLAGKDLFKSSDNVTTGIAKHASIPTRFYAVNKSRLINSKVIKVITHANVVDLEYDETNEQVSTVSFFHLNESHKVEAKLFTMCLGGIENARMLLHFNQKYNNKLGNEFDNVGRYFMEHPTVRASHFFSFDKIDVSLYQSQKNANKRVVGYWKLTENTLNQHNLANIRVPLVAATNYQLSDGISSFHILSDAIKDFSLPENSGSHLGNVAYDFDMVLEAVSRKAFDAKLFDSANDIAGFSMPVMIEQSPMRENRIYLSNIKDSFNVPKALIDWKLSQQDKDNVFKALQIIANEVGIQEIGRLRLLTDRKSRIWGDQIGFSNHHMGTTRMASLNKNGVVDMNLKLFGTNNFYITGSSVFCTGSHVPPTLTIVALTLRLAKHIREMPNV